MLLYIYTHVTLDNNLLDKVPTQLCQILTDYVGVLLKCLCQATDWIRQLLPNFNNSIR